MKASWTTHLNEREAQEIEQAFNASGALRDRLAKMLEKKIRASEKEQRSKELYSSPNWQFEQADLNGFNRALEHVISLIQQD